MSMSRKIALVSIAVSVLGLGLVVLERYHQGWWPF